MTNLKDKLRAMEDLSILSSREREAVKEALITISTLEIELMDAKQELDHMRQAAQRHDDQQNSNDQQPAGPASPDPALTARVHLERALDHLKAMEQVCDDMQALAARFTG